MIVQLHWQNRNEPSQTEFVDQIAIDALPQEINATEWASKIIEQRQHECPDGWCPMVCTEDSEHFTTNSNE